MNNPPGQQGPAPLSSYFQDAQPGEPSLAPLTPIDNTLANIGKLDKGTININIDYHLKTIFIPNYCYNLRN